MILKSCHGIVLFYLHFRIIHNEVSFAVTFAGGYREVWRLVSSGFRCLRPGVDHIKRAYRGSSWRRAAHMQEIMMLMKQHQRDEQGTMPGKVGNSLHSVVHWRSSKVMKKAGWLVQPIRTVWLNEIVNCATRARIEKERKENVTTLLNKFSMHDVEELADLVNERLQHQDCAQSFWKDLFTV